MKEQSHKSEMSAAVRGDFERLRARLGETVEESLQVPQPAPLGDVGTPVADEPAPVPEPLPPAAAAESEPEPASVVSSRSWLDRLRGR